MSRWRAVVFDLDDTLYPEREFVLGGFQAAAGWAEANLGIPAEAGLAELVRLYESGARGDTFNQWLHRRGVEAGPFVPRLVDAYRRHQPRIEPFAGVPALLKRLRVSHRLGLLSDGYLDVQRRKLDALRIADLFDVIVLSDAWGREAWKPSRTPFLEALRQLDVPAASAVYVGDNPLKDFLGARQVGLHTVQILRTGAEYALAVAPTPSHAADDVVRDVGELERLLAPPPAAPVRGDAASESAAAMPEKSRVNRIYLSPPHVFGDEQALVADAFASNWIAPLGPHVDAFEREFAACVGVPHAVALSSGTAGLHLAMRLLGVGPGDSVICSSMTFSASANPIRYEGASPVFIDADRTWTMDPTLLEDALNEADRAGRPPKAVVAVDLYGQCADYGAIRALCDRHGVPLVEDAAEALGATYGERPAGGFGRIGVFSFNGNKIITTSGGGMLVSHEQDLADGARFLATQARDPAPHYEHSRIGYNYRLSNVLAAIGRGQLRSLGDRVAIRRRIFERYVAGLSDLPGVEFMPEAPYGRCTRWLTCLLIDPRLFGADREGVRLALEAANIEARPAWKPMHLQPAFAGARMFGGAVSERLFRDGLCLPSGSSLRGEDQARVISTIRRACRT